MSDKERRDHLLLVIDHLLDTWNAWSADSDVRYITRALEDAVNDCIAVFADGSIPGNMRQLTDCVLKVQRPWEAWQRKNEISGGKYPLPDNDFWQALGNIEAGRQQLQQPVRKALEPLAELVKMPGMSPAQVCRMYGFTSDGLNTGEPDLVMLQEELAEPGKHTGPGTGWKPPHERRRLQDESRQDSIVKRIKAQREGKMKLLTAVAKESIEELIAQGVCGKQICIMKKIDGAELENYCQTQGIPVPAWQHESANQTTGSFDQPTDEKYLDSLLTDKAAVNADEPASVLKKSAANPGTPEDVTGSGEALTLEQEIVEYHKAGLSAKEIAEAVSQPGNEISHQKVNKVLARYKEDPGAFDIAPATVS